MKLAVRKEESIYLGNYHYMLMPKRMESDTEAAVWAQMGHIIIEVDQELGENLLAETNRALMHQIHIAVLAEKSLNESSSEQKGK